MELSQEQIEFYHENGYLIIDSLFSKEEIEQLNRSLSEFENLKSLPNVICEENGEIRSVFAPHKHIEGFKWLQEQGRLVEPSQQLLDAPIYMYQYKLNNKKALGGDWWEWHQDFPYWHIDDGVKAPKMLSAMILMQDTSSIQGPLIAIPRSHKIGIVDFEEKQSLIENGNLTSDLKHSLSSDLKYTIEKSLIKKLVLEDDIVAFDGKIGTCVFFHPNLFHASSSNLSPFDRNTAIITYNNVENKPIDTEKNRPDYICSRDFAPIVAIEKELEL
jgi:ectoine hydroxylase